VFKKRKTIIATPKEHSTSLYEIMITSEMFSYYQIYPKVVMSEFAVFYSTEDMTSELKLELEMILGIPLKFEFLPSEDLFELIVKEEKRDIILR